jgi:hypothetical protein
MHEKNYTPFLLKTQAAIWVNIFQPIPENTTSHYFLTKDPLEKLGKVHTQTLNRLQEAMNSFDFKIVYKKRFQNASQLSQPKTSLTQLPGTTSNYKRNKKMIH